MTLVVGPGPREKEAFRQLSRFLVKAQELETCEGNRASHVRDVARISTISWTK